MTKYATGVRPIIIIIIKITWHIKLGRGIPYTPERPQNHDTK